MKSIVHLCENREVKQARREPGDRSYRYVRWRNVRATLAASTPTPCSTGFSGETLYVKSQKHERKSKVSVSEAASRVGKQVYHTGQGQDERTEASHPRTHAPWPRSGLDSAWSVASNPHRESGTRWRAAADG